MSDNTELARSIGRVEGKIDLLIDLHKGTSKRLGAVEKRSWWIGGAMAVVVLVFNKSGLTAFLGH